MHQHFADSRGHYTEPRVAVESMSTPSPVPVQSQGLHSYCTGSPMGVHWDWTGTHHICSSRRVGVHWESHETPMGAHWESTGSPMRLPWEPTGSPLGVP